MCDMRRLFLVGVALFSLACGSADNVQYLPVGTRCTSSGQCGTNPYFCNESGYPGGYCEKPCTADGDCPSDSVCAAVACRRKCATDVQCRQAEGYSCRNVVGATTTYCEVSGNVPTDGGT